MHIFFNMMWIRQLAPGVGELYGVSRMIIIYMISGVVGFSFSSFAVYIPILSSFGPFRPGGITIGASAAVFGLLGAMVFYSRTSGSSMIGKQARGMAVLLFIFGLIFRGFRQLGSPGRLHRRIWRFKVVGPAPAGTSRPSGGCAYIHRIDCPVQFVLSIIFPIRPFG